MSAIGVIPARYGSVRFPGKPLADLLGKPMIQWVVEAAQRAHLLDEVLVATDDERIVSAVKAFGGKAVMTPTDCRSGTDRIAAALKGRAFDLAVNIQGDEPAMHPEVIDACVKALREDSSCDLSTPCIRIEAKEDYLSPHVVKVVSNPKSVALYFSRSPIPNLARAPAAQLGGRPFLAFKHLGLYVYTAKALREYPKLAPTLHEQWEQLEQLRFLENGYRIKVVEVKHDSLGIDTPEDLERLKAQWSKKGRK